MPGAGSALGLGSLTNGTSDAGAAAMLAATAQAAASFSQSNAVGLNSLLMSSQNPLMASSSLAAQLQRLYDPANINLMQQTAPLDSRVMEQLLRVQAEQQMVERYQQQPNNAAILAERDLLFRQQLFAASQQMQRGPPQPPPQTGLEALIEAQRQQQFMVAAAAAARAFPGAGNVNVSTAQLLAGYGKMPFTAGLEHLARHRRDDLYPPR